MSDGMEGSLMQTVKATATLTFRVSADQPEWAVREAIRSLHYKVFGAGVDVGAYDVELIKSTPQRGRITSGRK